MLPPNRSDESSFTATDTCTELVFSASRWEGERDISISLQGGKEDHRQRRAQYSLFIPKGLLIAEYPAKASGQKSSSESSGVCKNQVLKLLSGDRKSSY